MLIGETPIGELPGIGDSFSVLSKTYDMDMWVIFTGSEPLEGGAIRYTLNRNHDVLLKKLVPKTYEGLIGIGRSDLSKTFQINTGILKTLTVADFDLVLRPSYESTIPSTTVISALVWSYAEILDAVWRQMDTMANALKLEYAQDDDLDNAWGQIYDLPRLVSEDDTQYRDRLKTRTKILNSSGTKANCESIIDNVIGEEDASDVDTQYPSCVRISFNTDDYTRIAIAKKTTLDILIPQMLAAGVSYDLMLPLVDYTTDIIMNGPIWLPFNMYYGLRRRNNDATYEFDLINIFKYTIGYDMDILTEKYFNKDYLVSANLRNAFAKSYTMLIGLFGHILKTLPSDIIMSKLNILSQYMVDGYFSKNDLTETWTMDQISKITKRRFYRTESNLVFQKLASVEFDILSMLFAKSLDIDILNKRTFPKRAAMRMTLVGA